MTAYILRRLLMMIPTIFGVTIVSFLIMQAAPGDPLLSGGDMQNTDRETSHHAYLLQKRALGLDKPILLNFNGFREYRASVRAAAHFLGQPIDATERELPALLAPADASEEVGRRKFLEALKVPDLKNQLADPNDHSATAQSIVNHVQVWCEDTGRNGVPAAIELLRDEKSTMDLKRGAIRALNLMRDEPFVYTYGRKPSASETPAVTLSWRLWRAENIERLAKEGRQIAPDRRKQLDQALKDLATTSSRAALMTGLEQLSRRDVPYFVDKLLAAKTTLAERNVAAHVLRLHVGKPLATDVSLDAEPGEVGEVRRNWLESYDASRSQYEVPFGTRLAAVLLDTQYAHMVWRLITFDFGPTALKTREPVGPHIWKAFQVSAPLMLASEVLIYLIAVPLGIICAINRGLLLDRLISFLSFLLYSVPTFVAAMLLLMLLCYGTYWKIFPMSGLHSYYSDELSWGPWLLDYAWHAFLPVICLSLFSLSSLAMYARGSMLNVLSEDYIRTARAKGASEQRVIWKHALRNALIPVITLFADFLPAMLGGSVLVEVLFSIAGMGRLSWASIEQKDYPTLMALLYIDAIVVLLSILLSDLLYYAVDPRIRLDATEELA